MIRAVIFDMDGVIVDSEPVYQKMLQIFLEKNKVYASENELLNMVGISSQNYNHMLKKWWDRSGINMPSSEIRKHFDEFCDSFLFSYQSILNPNVESILTFLKRRGCKIGLASSSPQKDIQKVLVETGLVHKFDVIVSGEDFNESKPNPMIYEYTVSKLKVRKDECIAVEDSSYGIQAARNAGIKVIAKKDDRFGFDQSQADDMIEDLLELKKYVN